MLIGLVVTSICEMSFSNRLMRQPQQTKPMEFIDYVAQPPRIEWEPEKLTEEQLLNDCIEDNGLYYLIDENHSGFLFLTDEVAQKYNIKCGESARDDAEPIDWDIWDEEVEVAVNFSKEGNWVVPQTISYQTVSKIMAHLQGRALPFIRISGVFTF